MKKNIKFLINEIEPESEKILKNLNLSKSESYLKAENLKKIIKKYKKKYIYIYHLLSYGLFYISIKFYFLGLRGCKVLEQCNMFNNITGYIQRGIETAYSSSLFALAIFCEFFFKKNSVHTVIFIIIYIIIFINTQGNNLMNHGTYNCILFIVLNIIFLIYIYGIYFVILGFKSNKKQKICATIILLFLIFPFIFYITRSKCINWNYGLGNIEIEYNINLDSCKINNPNICTIGMFGNLFDLSVYLRKSCKGYNNDQKTFEKYLNYTQKQFNKYSYPDTSEFGDNYLSFTEKFPNMVEKEIWGFDEKKNNKDVTVKFTKGIGKINIDVKRKEKLVEERKKLYYNKVEFENIYIIYIDAISLQHFKRKFTKTTKLIEKMLYTNDNKKKFFKKFEAFQFVKYHNLGFNTMPNIFPLFYGNFYGTNKGIFISKYLKERGFITGCEHNSCNRGIFDFPSKQFRDLQLDGFDHENFALFCDTNFNDKKNIWSGVKGRNSYIRRCLYDEQTSKYMKNYFLDFCEKYKSERKYFSSIFTDGHEGTLEVVKYIDNDVHDLILNLLRKYFDDHSIIFIFSDHGAQMPGIDDVLLSPQKKIENSLGLFIIIVPNNNNINKENLHYNEQVLVTPLDIYSTFLDIINVKKNSSYHSMIGESVFKKLNRKNRNCQSLNITLDFCKCS